MRVDLIQCGYFKDITRKGSSRLIQDILAEIKNGHWRGRIEELRRLEGKAYGSAKSSLPAFMVSADTLNGNRKASDLGQHTGLMQIDIDHLADTASAAAIRQNLATDPHVLACWISPGGKGVKAIVPITADHERHKACFAFVKSYFQECHQLTIDERCSDSGRLCFVSHDPDLVLKNSAQAFQATDSPQFSEPVCVDISSTSSPSASTSYHLHNTTFIDYPGLQPFYRKLVVERTGKLSAGLRNAALVEIVPVLYSGIAPGFIPMFAEELYRQHEGIFRDSLEQHLLETDSLVAGCKRDYAQKHLSPAEASHYRELNERQQAVFRICNALSRIQSEECPPPFFFLSAEKLGHRLGVLDPVAHRELRVLCQRGVLEIAALGTRRQKGQPGRATRYRWMLD